MSTTPSDPNCETCGRPKSRHRTFTTAVGAYLVCEGRITQDEIPYFRRRKEDMPRLGVAPHPTVPLGSYVHVKSGVRYEVIGGAYPADREGDAIHVLYQSAADGYLGTRAPENFAARFRPVGGPNP